VGTTRIASPRQFYDEAGQETGEVRLKLTAVEAAKSTRTVAAP
jgi:hypothetical protein